MADLPYRGRGTDQEDDEEEEEEEIDETGYKTIKDAVLFTIDVSPSMLTRSQTSDFKKEDRDSPTSAALKCAYALMQQRIISNPNDMMGILLFGTEQSRSQNDDGSGRGGPAYPHCYLLADLDVPTASDVKKLKSLVEDGEESAQLLVASQEPVSMANVLFCANQIFTTKVPNFSSRRLFLVTDNDSPHSADKALNSAAAVRAKDLYDLGVVFELFPISRPEHSFDRSKFYDDIIYRATPNDPDAPAPLSGVNKASSTGDGITLLQSLLSNINSKSALRRALFSNLPFEIGPGLKISVKGYIVIKRQEPVRTIYVYLNGEKAQIAVGSSTQMAEDTARAVEKAEIRKAYKFGGETIPFTKEEITSIRNFGDPVLRIIGFKPLDTLPIWATTRPSTFIYPSEDDFIGSTRVFSALQQKLVKSQKMGIAWYIPRRNATPVLAAIIPGNEQTSDQGVQTMPAGLWIQALPFADDIRQNPETTLVHAPDSLIDMMRTVMQQLQLPKAVYDPSRYPNPALQWFYRVLQAMALDEDVPEKPDDKTIPKYRQIDKRAGAYVMEWGQELDSQFRAWQKERQHCAATGSKRAAPGRKADAAAAPKKIKAAGATLQASKDGGVDEAKIKAAYESNTLSKLTVKQLIAFLASKGERVHKMATKKADYVGQVEGYFEKK
ncbi:DSB repair complex subunit Ku70 [Cryomyces antarcticus]